MTELKSWTTPLTNRQRSLYDVACSAIHEKYGSYQRIANAVNAVTGDYVTGEGIRGWMLERTMPLHYAIVLADMADVSTFHLAPWLESYAKRWAL